MMEEIVMFVISALLGLGFWGAVAWVVLNPETLDVDKIFSIIAGLLLGLIFLGIAVWMLFQTHLRELWRPAAAASEPQGAAVPQKGAPPEAAKKPAS